MTQKDAEILGGMVGRLIGRIVGLIIGILIVTTIVYYSWNYGIVTVFDNLPHLSYGKCMLYFIAFRIVVSLIKKLLK